MQPFTSGMWLMEPAVNTQQLHRVKPLLPGLLGTHVYVRRGARAPWCVMPHAVIRVRRHVAASGYKSP